MNFERLVIAAVVYLATASIVSVHAGTKNYNVDMSNGGKIRTEGKSTVKRMIRDQNGNVLVMGELCITSWHGKRKLGTNCSEWQAYGMPEIAPEPKNKKVNLL